MKGFNPMNYDTISDMFKTLRFFSEEGIDFAGNKIDKMKAQAIIDKLTPIMDKAARFQRITDAEYDWLINLEDTMMIQVAPENVPDIHVFEKAGLGIAPFKCLFVWEMPSPALMNGMGGVELYNTKMQSAPCKVGCCAFCGMPLVYHYIIKDINGTLFPVGCECVAKTGDAGLESQVKALKKENAKEKREIKKAIKRNIALEERKAKIQGRLDKFASEYPEVYQFLSGETVKENCQPIWHSFMYNLKTWGNLTENQIKCVEKAIIDSKKPQVISHWIGIVGGKITTTLTIDKILTFPCSSFHYGDRNSIDCYILKDENGNIFIYKSKALQEDKKSGVFLHAGQIVNVTASIKAHEEYKGVRQTIIQRPKWTVLEPLED